MIFIKVLTGRHTGRNVYVQEVARPSGDRKGKYSERYDISLWQGREADSSVWRLIIKAYSHTLGHSLDFRSDLAGRPQRSSDAIGKSRARKILEERRC